MKKFLAAALSVLMLTAAGCSQTKTYESENLKISFELPKDTEVTETDNSVILMLSESIKAVIIESDATDMIGEDYASSNPTDNLDLTSGAFDTNYNNTIYVTQLFEYILSGSSRDYGIDGVSYGTFAGHTAIYGGFYSQTDEVNGNIYLFLENNICYIVCIYIYDTTDDTDDYAKIINGFEESFEIIK